jgi:hypothetical protein
MAIFTTALGLYRGVLYSGELRGPILHEAVPVTTTPNDMSEIQAQYIVYNKAMDNTPRKRTEPEFKPESDSAARI